LPYLLGSRTDTRQCNVWTFRAPNPRTSDFADQFPSAEVIGTDLSPTQPKWLPLNCKFELDDASLDWTYPDNTFGFIHIRCLLGCFKDWVKVYKECMRCHKPGGWLEHLDYSVHMQSDDGTMPPGGIWEEWGRLFATAGEKMGQTFEVIDRDNFVRRMEEAGFRDVKTYKTKLPMGGWPADKKWKEVGQFNKISCEEGLEGYALYVLTNVLGWGYEDVQVFLAKIRQALGNKKYHTYYPW
jgi:hypothetical protein